MNGDASLFGAEDLALRLSETDECAACGNPGVLVGNHCERCRARGDRALSLFEHAADAAAEYLDTGGDYEGDRYGGHGLAR
jgi:hypothetical protein